MYTNRLEFDIIIYEDIVYENLILNFGLEVEKNLGW